MSSVEKSLENGKMQRDGVKEGKSKGERAIAKVLDDLNVEYRTEYTFSQCRDQRCLPFDFMILIKGKCGVIEFDGRQHFESVPRFHSKDPEVASARFDLQQHHDVIKNRYTRDSSISILRISFKDEARIETLVRQYVELMSSSHRRIEIFSNTKHYTNPYGESSWSCTIV